PVPTGENEGPTVDARGFISELRAAEVIDTPLPGSEGRLHQVQTRELILARQRDKSAALVVPEPRPVPTEANTWLTYVDPHKRLTSRHPQPLMPDALGGVESVELVRFHPGGPDVIGIQIQPKTGDPEADRRNLDPEFHRRTLEEIWRQEHQDVLHGG